MATIPIPTRRLSRKICKGNRAVRFAGIDGMGGV